MAWFANGWPIVIQQWEKNVLVGSWLVVDGEALSGPAAEIEPAATPLALAEGRLEQEISRAIVGEKEVRGVVLKWYRDTWEKVRKNKGQ